MARAESTPRNSLWNEPVPRRVHAIAELGKQAFGQAHTEARVRVDTRVIQMTITIRGASKGKVSKKTFELFKKLAQEALDLDMLCVYAKHTNVHIKLSGTPQRAEKAEKTANKRKRRRDILEWLSYACAFWAISETLIAWRKAYRGGGTYGAWLSVALWVWMAASCLFYHFAIRWPVHGPMFRK
jgi:hypothetical protein